MRLVLMTLVALLFLPTPPAHAGKGGSRKDRPWRHDFKIDPADLASSGRNPYFILEPGYQLVYELFNERLVITVLDETKTIAGVETRVVEERESKGGIATEVSRNYYAISRTTRDVFCFGEDVDIYRRGEVVSHEGAWIADGGANKLGLAMPGEPAVGMRYYQEISPGTAMDRAEIVATDAERATPAGKFTGCLKVEETSPLEPYERERKFYARDVGLLNDDGLELVKHGMVESP